MVGTTVEFSRREQQVRESGRLEPSQHLAPAELTGQTEVGGVIEVQGGTKHERTGRVTQNEVARGSPEDAAGSPEGPVVEVAAHSCDPWVAGCEAGHVKVCDDSGVREWETTSGGYPEDASPGSVLPGRLGFQPPAALLNFLKQDPCGYGGRGGWDWTMFGSAPACTHLTLDAYLR